MFRVGRQQKRVQIPPVTDIGTTSDDYGRKYYESDIGFIGGYHSDDAHWEAFFGGVAEKLIVMFEPDTVLDAGCAKGLLVEAFVQRGVDAHGVDISSHAIGAAREAIRDRLTVGSLTDPISGRFDMVTCIETLEHMSRSDIDTALDSITAATDLVVFSSTPSHLDEPTHINVMQPAEWAALFAERGFFRRFDLGLAFISPWALAFERRPMTARDVVYAYEGMQWPLRNEANEKGQALLEASRALTAETAKARGFDELAAEAERRQVVIDELAAEAERRQVVIDEVAAEAEYRLTAIGTAVESRDAVAEELERQRFENQEIRERLDRLPSLLSRWLLAGVVKEVDDPGNRVDEGLV